MASHPINTVAAAAIGYACGLLPSAEVVTRLATDGTDVRELGTGNPGALNVATAVGPIPGAVVFVADVAKGFVAARLGRRVAGPTGANAAGAAAVFGHCFPATNGFRGGKGVAAGVGQVLATFPPYVPIDMAVAGAAAAMPHWKRRTFAANSVASAVWVVASVVWWRRQWPNLWGPRPTASLPIAAAASSTAIAWRFVDAQRRAGSGGAASS